MTPDEAIETLREAIGPRDLPHLGPASGWAQHAETLHRERHEALDRMASLARDLAVIQEWADRAAEWIKATGPDSTRPEYERRLLAEFDVLRERP